jgi:hypothetical protein
MDTKFWGPSGWRFLHLVAASGKGSPEFWETLPFILPCKFCRTSLTSYYKELPIPKKGQDIWLYKIHNKVNKKLRDQGQTLPPDPPQDAVLDRYKQLLDQGCTKTYFPGWDFLFCIADNHPSSSPSAPMPDTPEDVKKNPSALTLEDKNKYNLLSTKERKEVLKRFWASIPDALPFEEWRQSWIKYAGPLNKAVSNRRSALTWLWKIRCGFEADLNQMSSNTFYGLCKQIANHRSGCSTSKRAKTCRKLTGAQKAQKGGKRKTRRNKQR